VFNPEFVWESGIPDVKKLGMHRFDRWHRCCAHNHCGLHIEKRLYGLQSPSTALGVVRIVEKCRADTPHVNG
jgi:hypothetical protein